MTTSSPKLPARFYIHDLNERGGQDRSTLEIAFALAQYRPVELHAVTLDTARPRPSQLTFYPVRVPVMRPTILKSMAYHGITLGRELWSGNKKHMSQATGACALNSSIIQVQFIHAAWHDHPHYRDEHKPLLSSLFRSSLKWATDYYDLFTEKVAFKPSKTYIAISRNVASDLSKYFGINNRVHVIHHGVDCAVFNPARTAEALAQRTQLRHSWSVSERDFVFIFVGSYERKGLSTVIAAVAKLPENERRLLKVVAYGGGDQKTYTAMAATAGLSEQFRFMPPRDHIEECFRAADAFVLPTQYEAFGLVILEAAAAGLPVITSAKAGAAELFKQGHSALLLEDPRDASELARSLQTIINNTEERHRLGVNSLQVAQNRPWAQVAREYDTVFSALEGSGRD